MNASTQISRGWTAFARDIERVLWDEATIQQRVRELGAQIAQEYQALLGEALAENPPLVVGIFRGAIVFLADLIRAMSIPLECDYVQLYSYGKGSEAGEVQLLRDLGTPVAGRHVLLVEDIATTGGQVLEAAKLITEIGAKVERIVSVIDRQEGARDNIEGAGFTFESLFTKADLGITS